MSLPRMKVELPPFPINKGPENCVLNHVHKRLVGGCIPRRCKCNVNEAAYGKDGEWYCPSCWMKDVWGVMTYREIADDIANAAEEELKRGTSC